MVQVTLQLISNTQCSSCLSVLPPVTNGIAVEPYNLYVSAKLGAEYAKIRSNFNMLEARENSWGFYASPEVGVNVFPWFTDRVCTLLCTTAMVPIRLMYCITV